MQHFHNTANHTIISVWLSSRAELYHAMHKVIDALYICSKQPVQAILKELTRPFANHRVTGHQKFQAVEPTELAKEIQTSQM